jgi:hypothetical protein
MATLSCRQFTACGTPASIENLLGCSAEIPGTELIYDYFPFENRQAVICAIK